MQVELSQSEKVSRFAFSATITIPVIVGVPGTINIFRDQIHNPCETDLGASWTVPTGEGSRSALVP